MTLLRSVLHVKLVRDLWRLRGQALAIALVVAAGVGMVVMSFGMIRSLEATRTAYYDLYRFADVFAPVKRAPNSLLPRIAAIPGVATAETRISAAALLDVPGTAEPVSVRIHSLPPSGTPAINALVLRRGRLPDPRRPDEVVASEAFAKASRLTPGDRIAGLLYGKQIEFKVVGTALSPEYVYAVAPGQIFPDNRRFGVLWMGREPLAAALNLTEAFNEVVIRKAASAEEKEIVRLLDLLLADYGGVGAYGRDQQISDRFVSNEIGQLKTTVEILPPIFLAVAAFLLNIVLARLVDTEREVIGLLKAFGFRNRAIALHYGQLALLLSALGLVLGGLIGTWLGRALAGMYQQFFVFPFLRFTAGVDVYLLAVAATLAAVLLGSAGAVRRSARLTPAEAMRPPAPTAYSSGAASRFISSLGPDEPTRIILRGLVRRPIRTGLTILGLASAGALYIASASATDNVDRMTELTFGRAQRADLIVGLIEPRDAAAAHELRRLPGVLRVEPFRAAGARLRAGPLEEREGLSSIEEGGDLSRIINLEGEEIGPPAAGVILSSRLAQKLGVEPGDRIDAAITEGERETLDLRVSAIVESPLGSSAYLSRPALNRLLREGEVVSGAYLAVDPDRLDDLYGAFKQMAVVANVTVLSATLQGIRDTVAENMGIVTLFNTGFSVLIVLGVVYNSARISLSERARDLASLRVLGFRRGEVGFVLLGELAIVVILALPLAMAMGIALARYVTEQFSADLYTIPFGIRAATLGEGALVVIAAAAGTAILIRGRVDRLDLIRALKTRE